jgi:radical SAM protein with 4Fe4S-binding SPASM domain
MLGNDTFLLGNVKRNDYTQLMTSSKLQAVCGASLLENTECDNCVYAPYCGVCPVSNYALYGTLWAPQINTFWCQFHKDMFEYIFTKLQNPKIENIFKIWIGVKPLKGFKNIPSKTKK